MVIWQHERWRIVRIARGLVDNLYALEQYSSDGRRVRRELFAAPSDSVAIAYISWQVRQLMGDVENEPGGGEE